MKPATLPEIEYPESDGEPMGETAVHVAWTIRLLQLFQHRYAGQRALTGSNLIFYYVEGEPSRNVCPDVFVVKDCSPDDRRTFLVWKEERVPNCVVEVTSKSTRKRDEVFKPRIYAEIGIPEYFLYDPTAEYLDPALQGHRLGGNGYVRIEPDGDGRLESLELGLHFQLDSDKLVLLDAIDGARLLTEAEAERAAREAAETELTRLRKRLAELGEAEDA